jgi:uncharacterized protein (DUF433 family)
MATCRNGHPNHSFDFEKRSPVTKVAGFFSARMWYNLVMHERIEINPRIRHGQPLIKGTRVPVTRILAEVAAGTSFDRIEHQYDVTSDDIRAAVSFANELVEEQAFISMSAAGQEK